MLYHLRSKHLIDLVLGVLLLLLMPYQLLDKALHEWLGISLFAFTALHLVGNISWWKHLVRKPYPSIRILHTLLTLALTLSFFAAVLSGLLMSSHLFPGVMFTRTGYARGVHLVTTHWSFLLMGAHLGMHWTAITSRLKKRIHSLLYAILQLMMSGMTGYGIYQFFDRHLAGYLFYTSRYAFFDSQETLPLFLVRYLAMFTAAIMLASYLQQCLIRIFITKQKESQKNCKKKIDLELALDVILHIVSEKQRRPTTMYLENLNAPKDVKALSTEQLAVLGEEIREALLKKLSSHGGHIGPNLGLVEVSIALHYVFESPKDKIVYDVSHQSYIHKMLTGRKDAFLQEARYDEVSGYTNPEESAHDFFTIGHTSTSISLASGLAKARDLKKEAGNVIALIGDGSLSGGEAYEGLNYIAENGTNTIIIVNDNEMSIAENHGGLYQNLRELRESEGTLPCNFFKAMGFEYHYVADGHDLSGLIQVLKEVKDADHPIVLHVHTVKGKGYALAEQQKEHFHWGMPFDLATGASLYSANDRSYESLTADYLVEKMQQDPTVVAITSGTPAVLGFHKAYREQAGAQFVDVGIAEEHAVALASGIAKNGGKAVYGVYSSFLQRTYDQLSQDLCINQSPATILVFAASIHGMNDMTHLGIFDIAMISNIPNLVYLAPTCVEEYLAMLDWSIEQQEYPVAIRVPANGLIETKKTYPADYSQLNTFDITQRGTQVAIIGAGSFYHLAQQVSEKLSQQQIHATLINPRYLTGLDEAALHALLVDHTVVITLEDGILEGGYGQKIAAFYGTTAMKVKTYGFQKAFYDRYDVNELLTAEGLRVEAILEDITKLLS